MSVKSSIVGCVMVAIGLYYILFSFVLMLAKLPIPGIFMLGVPVFLAGGVILVVYDDDVPKVATITTT